MFSLHRFHMHIACVLIGLLTIAYPKLAQADKTGFELEHGKINTPDPSVVGPGEFEFETSYGYTTATKAWDDDGHTQTRGFTREHAMGFSFTAGLIDNLDVTVDSGHSWLKDKDNDFDEDGIMGPETGSGFGDTSIAGRYRFLNNEEQHLEIAYVGGFTLPTGHISDEREIGSSQGYWSFDQKIVGVKDWGPWTMNADVGYALPFAGPRSGARGTFNADVAGGYHILPWLQPEVEMNYAHDILAEAGDSDILAFTTGLVMPVHERLRINLGVQQGAYGRNADKATTLFIAVKTAF